MQLQQLIDQSIAFVHRAGLQVLDCGPGFAECRMPLTGNENHVGTMYAGAQFTLADITGGVLILASFDRQHYYPTLKNLTLDFLSPATSDLTLRCTVSADALAVLQQQLAGHGKAAFTLTGELIDTRGSVVTRSRGEFQVRALAR